MQEAKAKKAESHRNCPGVHAPCQTHPAITPLAMVLVYASGQPSQPACRPHPTKCLSHHTCLPVHIMRGLSSAGWSIHTSQAPLQSGAMHSYTSWQYSC